MRLPSLLLASFVAAACTKSTHHLTVPVEEAGDPPEVAVGERLFLETRFAEFFASHLAGGDVNAPLAAGDPTLDEVVDADGTASPGPFLGQAMNCRQCHLVDELQSAGGERMRTYGDFARRSPIPDRADGRATTPRNSPPLVNASLARPDAFFLHFDGEFATTEELVRATLTGRNYGWRADEHAAAVAHVARVIREDDGSGGLAAAFGALSYADTFAGAAHVPPELLLPAPLRIDVATATDAELLDAVAALVEAYLDGLVFQQDASGDFSGSPFDAFLARNGLPRHADPGESARDFSRRLRAEVSALGNPLFVTPADGAFAHHAQPFQFGPDELEGLRIFLAEPATVPPSAGELASGGIGNCIACHSGPAFTDFGFHNVDTAQAEYEEIHGGGSFAALSVPDLSTRAGDAGQFLPPSASFPDAEGVFLRVPSAGDARFTDLGVWNVFANPGVPGPQSELKVALCAANGLDPATTADDVVLPLALALFKTPGLRDLADSAPYMHTGQFDALEDVLGHYLTSSALARSGAIRNGDPQLQGIALAGSDFTPLAAFLRSLTDDYE